MHWYTVGMYHACILVYRSVSECIGHHTLCDGACRALYTHWNDIQLYHYVSEMYHACIRVYRSVSGITHCWCLPEAFAVKQIAIGTWSEHTFHNVSVVYRTCIGVYRSVSRFPCSDRVICITNLETWIHRIQISILDTYNELWYRSKSSFMYQSVSACIRVYPDFLYHHLVVVSHVCISVYHRVSYSFFMYQLYHNIALIHSDTLWYTVQFKVPFSTV